MSAGARRRAGWRSQRGFNLIEALVAMAIASIAFTVLYRTVGQSAKVVSDVDARVEAALVARSVLASGTFAEDLAEASNGQAGQWQWQVQIAPETLEMQELSGQPIESPTVTAARVDVRVSRADSAEPVLTWTGWKPYRKAP